MVKSILSSYSLCILPKTRLGLINWGGGGKEGITSIILQSELNIVHTFSGSYVRSLFNKSKPASERTGDPVKDVAGNFFLSILYLKQKNH